MSKKSVTREELINNIYEAITSASRKHLTASIQLARKYTGQTIVKLTLPNKDLISALGNLLLELGVTPESNPQKQSTSSHSSVISQSIIPTTSNLSECEVDTNLMCGIFHTTYNQDNDNVFNPFDDNNPFNYIEQIPKEKTKRTYNKKVKQIIIPPTADDEYEIQEPIMYGTEWKMPVSPTYDEWVSPTSPSKLENESPRYVGSPRLCSHLFMPDISSPSSFPFNYSVYLNDNNPSPQKQSDMLQLPPPIEINPSQQSQEAPPVFPSLQFVPNFNNPKKKKQNKMLSKRTLQESELKTEEPMKKKIKTIHKEELIGGVWREGIDPIGIDRPFARVTVMLNGQEHTLPNEYVGYFNNIDSVAYPIIPLVQTTVWAENLIERDYQQVSSAEGRLHSVDIFNFSYVEHSPILDVQMENLEFIFGQLEEFIEQNNEENKYYQILFYLNHHVISSPFRNSVREAVSKIMKTYMDYVQRYEEADKSVVIDKIQLKCSDALRMIGGSQTYIKKIKEKSEKWLLVNHPTKTNCLYAAVSIALKWNTSSILNNKAYLNNQSTLLKKLVKPRYTKFATTRDVKKVAKIKNLKIQVYNENFEKAELLKPNKKKLMKSKVKKINILYANNHFAALISKRKFEKSGINYKPKPELVDQEKPIRKFALKEFNNRIVSYDIESYQNPTPCPTENNPNLIAQDQIAYAVGWSFVLNDDEKIEDLIPEHENNMYTLYEYPFNGEMIRVAYGLYTGEGCLQKFLDHVLNTSNLNDCYLYAHNGGKFDIRLLFGQTNLYHRNDLEIKSNGLVELNGRILTMTIIKLESEQTATFRDSYPLLSGKLEDLTKEFNVPHKKLDGYQAKHKKFKKNTWENLWRIHDMAKYLMHDVLGLMEVLMTFNNFTSQHMKLNIQNCLTAASLAKKYFYTQHYQQDKGHQKTNIYLMTSEHDRFVRQSYCGGRCEVFVAGLIQEPTYYYDFTSLYPFCALNYLPVGKPFKVGTQHFEYRTRRLSKYSTAFWKVKVFSPKAASGNPIKAKPLFAIKENNKLLFRWFEDWTELYLFEPEIILARQLGLDYEFEPIEGLQFSCDNFMKDVVEKIFQNKQNARKDGNDALCKVWKIVINSMYGFFGLRTENRDGIEIATDKFSKWLLYMAQGKLKDMQVHGKYIVCRAEKDIHVFDHNVAVAAAISSYSRLQLYKLIYAIENQNGKVYYCDTDSVITNLNINDHPTIKQEFMKDNDGEAMGMLKNEIHDKIKKVNKTHAKKVPEQDYFDEALILAPKMYFLRTKSGVTSQACKGFKGGNPTWKAMMRCIEPQLPVEQRFFSKRQPQFKGGNASIIQDRIGVKVLEVKKKFKLNIAKGNLKWDHQMLQGVVEPYTSNPDPKFQKQKLKLQQQEQEELEADAEIIKILNDLENSNQIPPIDDPIDIDLNEEEKMEEISDEQLNDEETPQDPPIILPPINKEDIKDCIRPLHTPWGILNTLKWFNKQWPTEQSYNRCVKYLYYNEKFKTNVHRYANTNLANIISVLNLKAENLATPLYLYENLRTDVRLFADVDADDYLMKGLNSVKVLQDCLLCIKETAMELGVDLKTDNFRITSATNKNKLSFHIVHLDEVFETPKHQKLFWKMVVKKAEKYPDLWIDNQCVFDIGIYHKHRVMRTIFSEKPGKTKLLPIYFNPSLGTSGIICINPLDIDVEEYLISIEGKGPFKYSSLSSLEESVQCNPKPCRPVQAPKKMVQSSSFNESFQTQLKQLVPTCYNDFDLDKLILHNNFITLQRKQPGMCICCKRIHHKSDAFVVMDGNKIKSFHCFRK